MGPGYDCDADLRRARREMYTAVVEMKRSGTLGNWPSRLGIILDEFDFVTHVGPGTSAFIYDHAERTISFDKMTLAANRQIAANFGDEIGDADVSGAKRRGDDATNLFVMHELTHVLQNFPHFESVKYVKAGVGPEGLAMLDVSADFKAAWAGANIAWHLAGRPEQPSLSAFYTNMLLLSYIIGARGFPPEGRSHKIQRFLGVMLGAVLNQANDVGMIDSARVNASWHPTTPLFGFDVMKSSALNAFMTEPELGVLFGGECDLVDAKERLWASIGEMPTSEVFRLVATALAKVGILRKAEGVAKFQSIPQVRER